MRITPMPLVLSICVDGGAICSREGKQEKQASLVFPTAQAQTSQPRLDNKTCGFCPRTMGKPGQKE